MKKQLRQQRFDTAWHVLARRGVCDAFGGAQYRRLLRIWMMDQRLTWPARFISANANRPSYS